MAIVRLKGKENETKTLNFQENPIERRLIRQRSLQHCSAGSLGQKSERLKPFLPGRVQLPLDRDVTLHLQFHPPFGSGWLQYKTPSGEL